MQQNPATQLPDAEFKKRRNQKNWIVILIVFGCVGLIWAVTMLKFDPVTFGNLAHPDHPTKVQTETIKAEPQNAPEEVKHAQ